jgi:inosine-uridine nucleoside N-ribohydrolase
MTAVVVDCDPGQDDAVALLLALASPELAVLGITTVAGNVGLDRTSANALRVVEFAGRPDVPVFGGALRPLRRSWVQAIRVHGEHGLKGWELPPPRLRLQPQPARDFIIETARATDGLVLCALGPLTNVAAALTQAPDIARRLSRIVLMGGAAKRGNVSPVAEFNMLTDPDAAAIVFASGAEIVMIGLDVTHKVLVTPARLAELRGRGGRAGIAAAGMYDAEERYSIERYGEPGLPLHDPCVIAYVLRPELFAGTPAVVTVETEAKETLGRTVIAPSPGSRTLVIDRVDAEGFFELLIERLARL